MQLRVYNNNNFRSRNITVKKFGYTVYKCAVLLCIILLSEKNSIVSADRLFKDIIELSSALPPCWWRAGNRRRTGEVTIQSSLREADREKEIERGRWLAAKEGGRGGEGGAAGYALMQ